MVVERSAFASETGFEPFDGGDVKKIFTTTEIENKKTKKKSAIAKLKQPFSERINFLFQGDGSQSFLRWNFVGYLHIGDNGLQKIKDKLASKKFPIISFELGNNSIVFKDERELCIENESSISSVTTDLKDSIFPYQKSFVTKIYANYKFTLKNGDHDQIIKALATELESNLTVKEVSFERQCYIGLNIKKVSGFTSFFGQSDEKYPVFKDDETVSDCLRTLAEINASNFKDLFIRDKGKIIAIIEELKTTPTLENIAFKDRVFRELQLFKESQQPGQSLFLAKIINKKNKIRSLAINKNKLELEISKDLADELLDEFSSLLGKKISSQSIQDLKSSNSAYSKKIKICFEWDDLFKKEEIIKKVIEILKGNDSLKDLDLSGKDLDLSGNEFLKGEIQSLDIAKLTTLKISACSLNNDHLQALCEKLKITNSETSSETSDAVLSKLDLSNNKEISDSNIIKELLKENIFITEINLEKTGISEDNKKTIDDILQSRKDLYQAINSKDRLALKYALLGVKPNLDLKNTDKLFEHLTAIAKNQGNQIMLNALPKFKETIFVGTETSKDFKLDVDILSITELQKSSQLAGITEKFGIPFKELEQKMWTKTDKHRNVESQAEMLYGEWQKEMLDLDGDYKIKNNKFAQYQHFKEKIKAYGKLVNKDKIVQEIDKDNQEQKDKDNQEQKDQNDGFKKGDEFEINFEGDPKKDNLKLLELIYKAVYLEYDYFPHPTQMLSLLFLLDDLQRDPRHGTYAEGLKGHIGQIFTGEGKTIITATHAIAKYLFLGKDTKIDIISSNATLAQEGFKEQQGLFDLFNICSALNDGSNKDQTYHPLNKIIYGEFGEFVADWIIQEFENPNLRMKQKLENTHLFVDEADSQLIDHISTVMRFSHEVLDLKYLDKLFFTIFDLSQKYHKDELRQIVFSNQTLNIPIYLNNYVANNFDQWSDMAYTARAYELDKEYKITPDGQIIIMDIDTGEVQSGMEWSNGLQRFIQIKEGLYVGREGCAATFGSYGKFFRGYKSLCGITGTVGEKDPEQKFLRDQYQVDCFEIPHHRQFKRHEEEDKIFTLELDENDRKLLKENILDKNKLSSTLSNKIKLLLAENKKVVLNKEDIKIIIKIIEADKNLKSLKDKFELKETWFEAIKSMIKQANSIERKSMIKQANSIERKNIKLPKIADNKFLPALIICETIKDAKELYKKFSDNSDGLKDFDIEKNLHLVDSEEELEKLLSNPDIKKGLGFNHIIVATNLAGRGTDIKLSQDVNTNGGLTAILAYVPRNDRIKEQAFGRTGRQGRHGLAMMIAYEYSTSSKVDIIKQKKDLEKSRLDSISKNLAKMDLDDYYMEKYYQEVESQIFAPSQDNQFREQLKDYWVLWLNENKILLEQLASKEFNLRKLVRPFTQEDNKKYAIISEIKKSFESEIEKSFKEFSKLIDRFFKTPTILEIPKIEESHQSNNVAKTVYQPSLKSIKILWNRADQSLAFFGEKSQKEFEIYYARQAGSFETYKSGDIGIDENKAKEIFSIVTNYGKDKEVTLEKLAKINWQEILGKSPDFTIIIEEFKIKKHQLVIHDQDSKIVSFYDEIGRKKFEFLYDELSNLNKKDFKLEEYFKDGLLTKKDFVDFVELNKSKFLEISSEDSVAIINHFLLNYKIFLQYYSHSILFPARRLKLFSSLIDQQPHNIAMVLAFHNKMIEDGLDLGENNFGQKCIIFNKTEQSLSFYDEHNKLILKCFYNNRKKVHEEDNLDFEINDEALRADEEIKEKINEIIAEIKKLKKLHGEYRSNKIQQSFQEVELTFENITRKDWHKLQYFESKKPVIKTSQESKQVIIEGFDSYYYGWGLLEIDKKENAVKYFRKFGCDILARKKYLLALYQSSSNSAKKEFSIFDDDFVGINQQIVDELELIDKFENCLKLLNGDKSKSLNFAPEQKNRLLAHDIVKPNRISKKLRINALDEQIQSFGKSFKYSGDSIYKDKISQQICFYEEKFITETKEQLDKLKLEEKISALKESDYALLKESDYALEDLDKSQNEKIKILISSYQKDVEKITEIISKSPTTYLPKDLAHRNRLLHHLKDSNVDDKGSGRIYAQGQNNINLKILIQKRRNLFLFAVKKLLYANAIREFLSGKKIELFIEKERELFLVSKTFEEHKLDQKLVSQYKISEEEIRKIGFFLRQNKSCWISINDLFYSKSDKFDDDGELYKISNLAIINLLIQSGYFSNKTIGLVLEKVELIFEEDKNKIISQYLAENYFAVKILGLSEVESDFQFASSRLSYFDQRKITQKDLKLAMGFKDEKDHNLELQKIWQDLHYLGIIKELRPRKAIISDGGNKTILSREIEFSLKAQGSVMDDKYDYILNILETIDYQEEASKNKDFDIRKEGLMLLIYNILNYPATSLEKSHSSEKSQLVESKTKEVKFKDIRRYLVDLHRNLGSLKYQDLIHLERRALHRSLNDVIKRYKHDGIFLLQNPNSYIPESLMFNRFLLEQEVYEVYHQLNSQKIDQLTQDSGNSLKKFQVKVFFELKCEIIKILNFYQITNFEDVIDSFIIKALGQDIDYSIYKNSTQIISKTINKTQQQLQDQEQQLEQDKQKDQDQEKDQEFLYGNDATKYQASFSLKINDKTLNFKIDFIICRKVDCVEIPKEFCEGSDEKNIKIFSITQLEKIIQDIEIHDIQIHKFLQDKKRSIKQEQLSDFTCARMIDNFERAKISVSIQDEKTSASPNQDAQKILIKLSALVFSFDEIFSLFSKDHKAKIKVLTKIKNIIGIIPNEMEIKTVDRNLFDVKKEADIKLKISSQKGISFENELECLNLEGQELGNEDLKKKIEDYKALNDPKLLMVLKISKNLIGDIGDSEFLLDLLKDFKNLEELNIGDNPIVAVVLKKLIEDDYLKNLKILRISAIDIDLFLDSTESTPEPTTESKPKLTSDELFKKMPNLQILDLSSNNLAKDDNAKIDFFLGGNPSSSLKELDLSSSNIAKHIGLENLFSLTNLKKLNLSACALNKVDFNFLSPATNKFLFKPESLDLSFNAINDQTLNLIISYLENGNDTSLRFLDLSSNSLTKKGYKKLISYQKSHPFISVRGFDLEDEIAIEIDKDGYDSDKSFESDFGEDENLTKAYQDKILTAFDQGKIDVAIDLMLKNSLEISKIISSSLQDSDKTSEVISSSNKDSTELSHKEPKENLEDKLAQHLKNYLKKFLEPVEFLLAKQDNISNQDDLQSSQMIDSCHEIYGYLSGIEDDKKIAKIIDLLSDEEKPIKIDSVNLHGDSFLHIATRNSNIAMMQALIGLDADPKALNHFKKTPLDIAIKNYLKIIQKFDSKINHNSPEKNILLKEFIKIFSSHFPIDQNEKELDQKFLKLAISACESGYDLLEVLKILYKDDLEISPNQLSKFLNYSAQHGQNQVVKTLIDRKVDIEIFSKEGSNALHLASQHGHNEVVKTLIEAIPKATREVYIAELTKEGLNALHLASQHGHNEVVKTLIEALSKETRKELIKSAIIFFKTKSDYDAIITLANGLAKVEKISIDESLKTLLDYLEDSQAGSQAGSQEGSINRKSLASSLLQEIIENPFLLNKDQALKIIPSLICEIGDVNKKFANDNSLLHLATIKKNPEIVQALIGMRADINAENKQNETPLHLALNLGNQGQSNQSSTLNPSTNPPENPPENPSTNPTINLQIITPRSQAIKLIFESEKKLETHII